MEDFSIIMCVAHDKQINTVCTRDDCNQTRSCCELCKNQHQGHQDDLIDLNKLKNQKKEYDTKFEEIQNQINTQLKNFQSGLQSIFQKSPTQIKNPAEIEIFVLYCQELKEFISNFHLILNAINPALNEVQKILSQTTTKITSTFKLKYNNNLNKDNPIYKTAYNNFITSLSERVSNQSIEKQDIETITEDKQEKKDDQIISQIEVKKTIDAKETLEKSESKQSQNNINKINQKQQNQSENEQQSKINQQQQPISHLQFQEIRFSLQDKYDKITLSSDQMVAEGSQFVLCENVIGNEQINKFAFQVVTGEYIFVGACHQEIIKKNKYEASLKKEIIGHGAYLMTSYGYVFSHMEYKYNGGKLKFNFSNTDIVVIEIDRTSNRIKWKVYNEKDTTRSDQTKRFSMQFDPKQDLCPCVYLLYNSKVKIYKQED